MHGHDLIITQVNFDIMHMIFRQPIDIISNIQIIILCFSINSSHT